MSRVEQEIKVKVKNKSFVVVVCSGRSNKLKSDTERCINENNTFILVMYNFLFTQMDLY